MKTKIFGLVAIVCIAFAASFIANNVSKSSSALSMVAAANVEALAQRQKDDRDGGEVSNGYKYVSPGAPGSGVECTCWQSGGLSCCR